MTQQLEALLASPSLFVAPRLLGMVLRRVDERTGRVIEGQIVEVEAYAGVGDRAAHCYDGHRSPRNEVMYGRAGRAYVYFTYGMHHCMNIVCAHEGDPQAVLIRALEPVAGLDAMHAARHRRGRPWQDHELCAGPGRLCQALGIDRTLDGTDLLDAGSPLRLIMPRGHLGRLGKSGGVRPQIRVGPRIGIDSSGPPWRDRPMRFWLAESRSVSKFRAAGRPWSARSPIPGWANSSPTSVVRAD